MEEKLLRINLTDGKSREEIVHDDVLRKYLGGRGLGVKILLEETKQGIDPLSPENKLIFMTGPATGTMYPLSGRFHVVTKAPLTGGIGDSNCGGKWGPELRFAGYFGMIIEGRSERPVYIWLHDGEVEVRSAGKYWGMSVYQLEDTLREELGDVAAHRMQIACIGPAGENLVMFAAIMTDKHRAAGRTGVGAVMGSKNLKAIAVRGSNKPQISNSEEFRKEVTTSIRKLRDSGVTGNGLPKYGTSILVNVVNEHGILPTKNFQTGVFPTAEKTSGETIAKEILTGKYACWGCIVACGRVTKVTRSPYQVEGEGPEYENNWAFGVDCGIDDLDAITKATNICDELGLDPMTAGATIACAMELYEKGKIPKAALGGMELKFGNPQTVVELAWRTAYKIGFGSEIALGSKRLAEKYGAPELAMHVKGLELPAYDPRGVQGMGLSYATSNRGGCHLRAYTMAVEVVGEGFGSKDIVDRFSTDGKAKLVKTGQDVFSVLDSLVVCKFTAFPLGPEDFVRMLNPITGWDWSVEDFIMTGERIYNLERLYINREGFDAKDDTLPKRLLEEPLPEGSAKGHVVKLKEMLEEYYNVRGWKDGKPTKEKLDQLGLIDFSRFSK